MNASIEFVYFDLGNILLSFDPQRACRNLASQSGVSVDQVKKVVYGSGLQDQFEHGQCSAEEFAFQVRRDLAIASSLSLEKNSDLSLDQISSSLILDALSDMFTPIESMTGIPQEVQASGCRVGVLSNTCHAHWDWIARQKYAVTEVNWDVTILSHEAQSMKPECSIYEVAERKAAVDREQILFLDDKEENTAAARDRGWNAVTCTGGESSIKALRSFGLGVEAFQSRQSFL